MNLLLQLRYNLTKAPQYASVRYICDHGFTKDFPWKINISSSEKEEVKDVFYQLTALYIIIRKACGFSIPDVTDEELLNTPPLGVNTPPLCDILTATRIRVACVPLAGLGGNPPMLAMRFLINNQSYWQEGVKPDGLSYRLADKLLCDPMTPEFQEELFRYWIITGDISGNIISGIELGNKLELIADFPKRRWLLPEENGREAIGCNLFPVKDLQEATAVINDVSPDYLLTIIREDNYDLYDKRHDAYGNLLLNADADLQASIRAALNGRTDGKLYSTLLKAGIFDTLFLERCQTDNGKKDLELFLKNIRKVEK